MSAPMVSQTSGLTTIVLTVPVFENSRWRTFCTFTRCWELEVFLIWKVALTATLLKLTLPSGVLFLLTTMRPSAWAVVGFGAAGACTGRQYPVPVAELSAWQLLPAGQVGLDAVQGNLQASK
jgi:hypothetical protein